MISNTQKSSGATVNPGSGSRKANRTKSANVARPATLNAPRTTPVARDERTIVGFRSAGFRSASARRTKEIITVAAAPAR